MISIKTLKNKMSVLESGRNSFESIWLELAKSMSPSEMRLNREASNSFYKKNYIDTLNSTAQRSISILASALNTGLTNPSRQWLKYAEATAFDDVTTDAGTGDGVTKDYFRMANPDQIIKYHSKLTNLFSRTIAKSNFYSCTPKLYADFGLHGCACLLAHKRKDAASFMHFTRLSPGEFYADVDATGAIHCFGRKFRLSIYQILDLFCKRIGGYDLSGLGPEMKLAAEQHMSGQQSSRSEFEVHQIIYKNESYITPLQWETRIDLNHERQFISAFYDPAATDALEPLAIDGYDVMPAIIPRWRSNERSGYSEDSLGMAILGDVEQLTGLEEYKGQVLELLANPRLVSNVDDIDSLSGGISYISGMTTNPYVRAAYEPNVNALGHIREEVSKLEQNVKDNFNERIFLSFLNQDTTGMTATEANLREAEKATLLGPLLHSINTTMLDPLSEVFLSFANDLNLMPKDPLLDGVEINPNPEYVSTMHQAQKMIEIAATQNLMQFVGSMAPMFPDVLLAVNEIAVIRQFANNIAADPNTLRSDEEVDARLKAKSDALQQQQAAQAMQVSASAARDLAQARTDGDNVLSDLSGMTLA